MKSNQVVVAVVLVAVAFGLGYAYCQVNNIKHEVNGLSHRVTELETYRERELNAWPKKLCSAFENAGRWLLKRATFGLLD